MSALPPVLLKTIKRIQILSTQLANDILAGAYRSAFKGKGMEFEEVREYQSGDEVRSIDWNVTARMNKPYVKNFREERDLIVILAVDVSSSSWFGSGPHSKKEWMAEIGAVLAFSAIKNNDKIGLLLFSDQIEHYIPPRKGTRHVLHIIRELLFFEPVQRGTNLKIALSFLGETQHRSGICFLISDFLAKGYEHEMSIIAKKHDLITIRVLDSFEQTFPTLPLAQLTDLESGKEIMIDSARPIAQKAYSQAALQRMHVHQQLVNKVGAGLIDIVCGHSYMVPLRKFFKIRQRQRR